jgi:hypothetical protein
MTRDTVDVRDLAARIERLERGERLAASDNARWRLMNVDVDQFDKLAARVAAVSAARCRPPTTYLAARAG